MHLSWIRFTRTSYRILIITSWTKLSLHFTLGWNLSLCLCSHLPIFHPASNLLLAPLTLDPNQFQKQAPQCFCRVMYVPRGRQPAASSSGSPLYAAATPCCNHVEVCLMALGCSLQSQVWCLPVFELGPSTTDQEASLAAGLSLDPTLCVGIARWSERTHSHTAVTPVLLQPARDFYYMGIKINNLNKTKEKINLRCFSDVPS